MSSLENWIWGDHSVKACFECAPDQLLEIFIEKSAHGRLWKFFESLEGLNASIVEKLPRFLSERRTQGVAAKIKHFPVQPVEKFYEITSDELQQVVVLDRIQDPQNFGAILRSAAALGAKNVFIGSREQCPVNGTVAQVSAGNLFRLNIYICHNIAKTCENLSNKGFQLLALESGGIPIEEAAKTLSESSVAWILGAEEDGIQSAILKLAHQKVGIPMIKGVESLNVSNSAAIALYEGLRSLKK